MPPKRVDSGDIPGNVLFGPKPVLELLQSNPERIETVFLQKGRTGKSEQLLHWCRRNRVRFRLVDRDQMNRLFPVHHQGVAARVFQPGFVELPELLERTSDSFLPLVLALDQVQDPGNIGTLTRTLVGAGGGGLLVPRDRSASLGAAASKSSAGALGKADIAQVVNLARSLDQCRDHGLTVYGAARGQGSTSLYDSIFRFPAVLVLGNEEKGIRPNVLKRCDHTIHIPMHGSMESYNVAQAGAMILGEVLRQWMST